MKANARVDASSIKYILLLAWPAILEQILLTMATYVDTAMIGALGYRATAAVAVNSSTTWLVLGFLTALGVGYSVQVAHSLGAKKKECTGDLTRGVYGFALLRRDPDAAVYAAVILYSAVAWS